MIKIISERLSIRRVCADDWRAIMDLRRDFASSEYARYDRPWDTSPEAVRPRVERWAAAAESDEHMFFAVCTHGEVIGYVAFNACGADKPDEYETGYCFHSAYHGRGYAKESMEALLAYIRVRGLARCITAGTALDNTPSVRLLESLGFALAGTEDVSFYNDEHGRPIAFTGGIFRLIL